MIFVVIVSIKNKRLFSNNTANRKSEVVIHLTHPASITLSEIFVNRHNMDTLDRQVPGWLEASNENFEFTVRDLPQREHIDVPVREQLIVELYSK